MTETVGADGNVRLTLYVELDGGVGHPHHVLRDTGQLEVVVVPADVEQSQVDGVDVGPVHVGLGWETSREQVDDIKLLKKRSGVGFKSLIV